MHASQEPAALIGTSKAVGMDQAIRDPSLAQHLPQLYTALLKLVQLDSACVVDIVQVRCAHVHMPLHLQQGSLAGQSEPFLEGQASLSTTNDIV